MVGWGFTNNYVSVDRHFGASKCPKGRALCRSRHPWGCRPAKERADCTEGADCKVNGPEVLPSDSETVILAHPDSVVDAIAGSRGQSSAVPEATACGDRFRQLRGSGLILTVRNPLTARSPQSWTRAPIRNPTTKTSRIGHKTF